MIYGFEAVINVSELVLLGYHSVFQFNVHCVSPVPILHKAESNVVTFRIKWKNNYKSCMHMWDCICMCVVGMG